jgi:isopenicillin-N N-acyltransferase-like protein
MNNSQIAGSKITAQKEITEKNKKLPLINVSGTNEEIGKQVGTLLKARILKTIDFYKTIFKRSQEEVFNYAEMFKREIHSFNDDYIIEIEAMSKACDIDPLWIFALNSRSEILNKFSNECTTSFFKNKKILGQNWDWAPELEDLSVIIRLKQENKPDIIQMTEPGIIGKIGFNSNGLGVCLNFLHLDGYEPKGIPTHILLRGILDCNNIEQAKILVKNNSIGRTSNFLVADKFGACFDIEFAGDEHYFLEFDKSIIHTNHYLGKNLNPDRNEFLSSYKRYERSKELLESWSELDLEEFKLLLTDKTDLEMPICRKYEKPTKSNLKLSGTVCSIIMDLQNRILHITRGNPYENKYEEIMLN